MYLLRGNGERQNYSVRKILEEQNAEDALLRQMLRRRKITNTEDFVLPPGVLQRSTSIAHRPIRWH